MRTLKTQGWYVFTDGTATWFHGLSAAEKRNEERKHGKIILFNGKPVLN